MRLDPPLDPTSSEARKWLEDELRKSAYHERRGLLARLWDWLSEQLGGGVGTGGFPAWTLGIVVVVAIAVLGLVIARSVAAERRMAPATSRGVLDGPSRTSGEHRAAARQAIGRGDADTAVLESYRAIARAAVERAILDDQPGRTAHEVALALAPVFPSSGNALARAADTFDAVRYGRRPAGMPAAEQVLAVDTTLAAARPVFPEPSATRRP